MNPNELPLGKVDLTLLTREYRGAGHLYHACRRTPKTVFVDQYYDPYRKEWNTIRERGYPIDEIFALGVSPETYHQILKRAYDQTQEMDALLAAQSEEIEPIHKRHIARTRAMRERHQHELEDLLAEAAAEGGQP